MTRTDFPDVIILAGAFALLAAVIALTALGVNSAGRVRARRVATSHPET